MYSLQEAFKADAPHMAKKNADTTEILIGARLRPNDVAATDRYTAAVAKFETNAELIGVPEEGVVVPFDLVTQIAKEKDLINCVEVSDGKITVSTLTSSYGGLLVGGDYPPVDRLIPEKKKSDTGTYLINPDYMARFAYRLIARGRKGLSPLRVQGGNPIRVDFEDKLIGLIMPMREH